MFSPNLMNDLIHAKLTKIAKLQNIFKKDDLRYKLKHGKTLVKYSQPIVL